VSLATLLLGIVIGIVLGAIFAYLWTSRKDLQDRFELSARLAIANVHKQVFALEGCEGQNAALADFKLEQIPLLTDQGVFRKKFLVTLNERLVYRGIPFPWWTTTIPVAESLDKANLDAFAKAASVVLKSADLNGLGIEIMSRLIHTSNREDSTRPPQMPTGENSNSNISTPKRDTKL
jgi:hypothetical protein